MTIITKADLICLHCDTVHQLDMPTDACQFFFYCTHCHTLLKPKTGDCCVFCSYGDTPCPPLQVSLAADRLGEADADAQVASTT